MKTVSVFFHTHLLIYKHEKVQRVLMKLLYIEIIIRMYVLNMLLTASKEDPLRNPCALLPSEPGGAVTPPIGTPSLHTLFSVDRYLWFHSQCVHCLRMELVRWHGSRHLRGAVTGFPLVSPGAVRHAAPIVLHATAWGKFLQTLEINQLVVRKKFSVDVCILDANVFDQMSKSAVFFIALFSYLHIECVSCHKCRNKQFYLFKCQDSFTRHGLVLIYIHL